MLNLIGHFQEGFSGISYRRNNVTRFNKWLFCFFSYFKVKNAENLFLCFEKAILLIYVDA